MATASPRNLDPKFTDETDVPADADTVKDVTPVEAYETDTHTVSDDDLNEESHIVVRENGEITHGPIPVSKWAAYEKENGL